MPLTSIRLQNFKCFADSGEIPLAPLTVIFGRNNTGKSSILRSLLLLRQTLDSPGPGQQLNLSDRHFQGGAYQDIVHQHKIANDVTLHFSLNVPNDSRVRHVEIEFGSKRQSPPRLNRLKVGGPGSAQPLEFRRGKGAGGPFELWIEGKKIGLERRGGFAFGANLFFPIIGSAPPRVGRPNEANARSRKFGEGALTELQKIIQGVRAIGAFRQQPKRQYEFQGHSSQALDLAGQSVVDALIEDSTRRGKRRNSLLPSVNQWLRRIGRVRVQPLRQISRTRRIFEVRLKDTDSGRWANFADVGFGIGQALPVIVEGLRAEPGTTLLIEEPEIHLHPDAQLAMGDFLADLARSGKQVLVETHSENLLLRLRRLIVGGRRGGRNRRLDPSDVSIIYVDKDREGESHATRLSIDDLGQIKGWPEGFMEEATEERLQLLKSMSS